MLSPRDIYPPEWFQEPSFPYLAAKKISAGVPEYKVRQLESGCKLFQIVIAPNVVRRTVPVVGPESDSRKRR